MYKNDNTLFLQYNVYIDLSSILCFLSFLADTLTIFKQHLLNKAIYGLCITKWGGQFNKAAKIYSLSGIHMNWKKEKNHAKSAQWQEL